MEISSDTREVSNRAKTSHTRRMRRVALSVGGGAAAGRILTLGAALAAAAIMGPGDFGRFSIVLASAQMLGAVSSLGLARGLVRILPKYDEVPVQQMIVWICSVGTSLILVAAVGLSVFFGPEAFTNLWLPGDSWFFRLGLALWIAGFAMSTFGTSALMGAHRQAGAARWVFLRSILFASTLVAGSLLWDPGHIILACGAIEFALASLLLALVTHSRRTKAKEGPVSTTSPPAVAPLVPELARNGAPGWLADVSIQFTIWATLALLSQSPGGVALAGIFAVGQRAFVAVAFLPRQVALSFVPFLVKGWESSGSAWRSSMRSTLAWTVGLGMLMAALATLLLLVADDRLGSYADHRLVLVAMSFVGVIAALNTGFGVVAQASGQLARWAVSDVVASAVIVLLTWSTIGTLGIWAAVVGFSTGHIARCLILVRSIRTNPGGV